jgi:hypothetical protein
MWKLVNKVTQEIFSELEETKAKPPIFPGHRMKTEGESEGGQWATTPGGGAGDPWGTPSYGVRALATLWRRLSAYIKPSDSETLNQLAIFQKKSHSSAATTDEF